MNYTILHPWFGWMFVLTLRAQMTPYTSTYFITSAMYATILTLLFVGRVINQGVAYGKPREVDLGEEVVVITGGASGLGLLIAQIYGIRGVSVAVLDVKGPETKDGDEDILASDGLSGLESVECYRCDVGNKEEVEDVLRRVDKDLGTPTVLINCAAASINGQPILSLPAESFQRTIQINLLGVFNTCQVILPGMLSADNGGTVVTVSSVLGHLTPACLSDYSASKAGLSALHRTLEAELRASGHSNKVKTILVETGQMSTPLFEKIKTPSNFFAPVLEPVQVAQEIVSAIDSGRGGVIRLPTFAAVVSWYAVLPAALQRIARYLSGIDFAVAKATPQGSISE